ncbi:MAG: hypothetical protein LBK82_17775 [Planctomycetaceae bacterium]|nr:hypothetical protein [Planctomycetaceae bacterium]
MLPSVWDSIKTQPARPFSEGIAHLQKVTHLMIAYEILPIYYFGEKHLIREIQQFLLKIFKSFN